MRLLSFVFATIALSTSLVSALPSEPGEGGLEARHTCRPGYFWYDKKSVCVKDGGSTPGTPGKGKSCPTKYYWHNKHKFCVPKTKKDDKGDNPECKKDHKWNKKKNCCNLPEYSCDRNEFWWKDRSTCLKKGGPRPKRNPPKGKKCPPRNWSWNYKLGCCAPHYSTVPAPKCEKDWEWKKDIKCCNPKSTHTNPPPSHPSNKPYDDHKHDDHKYDDHKHDDHKHHKRDLASNEQTAKRLALRTSKPVVLNFCPTDYEQCPVGNVEGEYECLDTRSEMTSCGGCTSTGAGVDCTAIPNVDYASCYGGTCNVFFCKPGFKPSDDERSCEPA